MADVASDVFCLQPLMAPKALSQSQIARIPHARLIEELKERQITWDEDDTDLELRARLSRAVAGPKKQSAACLTAGRCVVLNGLGFILGNV